MKRMIALLLLSTLVLSGCAGTSSSAGNAAAPDAVSAATEKRYREGELREYDGERLDPAVGPGDNSIKGVQTVNMDTYRLTIDGLADTPQSYTYDEVTALPGEERLLRLYCVEGWNANILWKGVPLKTLLEAAEPHAEANTIIFHAVDGYTTSMPLQEILDHNLILAYDANGIALPPELAHTVSLLHVVVDALSVVPATAITYCDAAGQLGVMPPLPHSSEPESPVETEIVWPCATACWKV